MRREWENDRDLNGFVNVRILDLGIGVTSGVVAKICTEVGCRLTEGQTILELDTNRGVIAVPSPGYGEVKRIRVRVGDSCREGNRILALEERDEHQDYCFSQMNSLDMAVIGNFFTLFTTLDELQAFLNQAETDFSERAFIPFWNAIEKAATCLEDCDRNIIQLGNDIERFRGFALEYRSATPPPTLSSCGIFIPKMIEVIPAVDRMKSLVRAATRDYEFTSIYLQRAAISEQRTTNQILVAGFSSLSQAIEGVALQIGRSIDNLCISISDMSSTLDQSIHGMDSNLANAVNDLRSQVADGSGQVSSRVDALSSRMSKDSNRRASKDERSIEKALDMLDNIQRHRKPPP